MFRLVSAAALSAVAVSDSTWGPSDSAHALDGVIGAVEKIVHLPHLSAKQLDEAKKIAADIKGDVEAVESGKLTKEQAHDKVGEGMKELAAFASTLSTPPADASARKAELEKKLHEKEDALAKLQKQMEVLKLKKELVEKKLMLQKLLAAKAASGKDHSDAEDAKTVAALSNQLHLLSGNANGAAAAKALQAVQDREKAVSARLAQLEEQQKKSETMMKAAVEGELKTGGQQKDALEKGKKMIQELEKREKRKFAKVRAGQQLELDALKETEASLKSHDATALQKAVQKLDEDTKALQAKSGKFLY